MKTTKHGHLKNFPQTVEEVAEAEKYMEQHPPEIPESLRDTRAMLERIKARRKRSTLQDITQVQMAMRGLGKEDGATKDRSINFAKTLPLGIGANC